MFGGMVMGLCKDPRLTYLNSAGYNVVKLPRAGIAPLDVLARGKGIDRLGPLDKMVQTDAAPPVPGPAHSAADMAGTKTADLDVTVGLKLLSNILGGMIGAALPSLDIGFSRARFLQFRFGAVSVLTIDPAAIGAYLADATLDPRNPFNEAYFLDDDSDEFVIYETLRAREISVVAKDGNKVEVGVDVPAIKGVVGVKVDVAANGQSESDVTFTGQEELTFGFKCFRLAFDDGRWRVSGEPPSGDLAFAVPGAAADSPVLLGRGRMTTIG